MDTGFTLTEQEKEHALNHAIQQHLQEAMCSHRSLEECMKTHPLVLGGKVKRLKLKRKGRGKKELPPRS